MTRAEGGATRQTCENGQRPGGAANQRETKRRELTEPQQQKSWVLEVTSFSIEKGEDRNCRYQALSIMLQSSGDTDVGNRPQEVIQVKWRPRQ